MLDRIFLTRALTTLLAVWFFLPLPPVAMAQEELREECSDCLESDELTEESRVFRTPEQTFRVVPMKGLSRPWALEFLPNGDILITERAGRLRIVRDGKLDPEPIAGVPDVIRTMRKGLMDIKLHPNYAQNQFVYFTYHKQSPDHRLAGTPVLARGKFEGGAALMEVRDLFQSDAWYSGVQASRIEFGPDG